MFAWRTWKGVSIPLRKFRKQVRGSRQHLGDCVSIPLRKFRKYYMEVGIDETKIVSIPLRKFRKNGRTSSSSTTRRSFHPSKEVSEEIK